VAGELAEDLSLDQRRNLHVLSTPRVQAQTSPARPELFRRTRHDIKVSIQDDLEMRPFRIAVNQRARLATRLEPFHLETGPDETKHHFERPVQIIWPIAGRRHRQQLARSGQERLCVHHTILPLVLRRVSRRHRLVSRAGRNWRSASKSGDTKTPKSKRSLELPRRASIALTAHAQRQARERRSAGATWHDNDLVFCHESGNPCTSDQLNWRFSKMTRKAGIGRWHAHEGRHTAVSIMSTNGVPIQEISDTVGHKSTHVTETVYCHVIVPEIRGGATVMDDVFNDDSDRNANAENT
jgi:hypothetical protein